MYKRRKYLILIRLEDIQSTTGDYFYSRMEYKKIITIIKTYTQSGGHYYELNDIRAGILETEALYKEQCVRYILNLNHFLKHNGYSINLKSITLEIPIIKDEQLLETVSYRDLIDIIKELFSKDIFIKDYYTRVEVASIVRFYIYGLDKSIFSVYNVIQPKMNILNNKCTGGEVLSRIKEFNVDSSIDIEQIVVILVKLELIKELDKLSLQTTLAYIHKNAGSIRNKKIRISSNLSLLHFHKSNYISEISSIIDSYRLEDINCLDLEITEYNNFTTQIINNVNALIQRYKNKVQFHLDDVGSINGFTSVDIITRASIDKIKLDKEILYQDKSKEDIIKIIQGIKIFADSFDTGIICEGVENIDQENILREIGVKEAQGYFYAKPMPLNEFQDKYLKEK